MAVSVITRCELFAGTDEHHRIRRALLPIVQLPVDSAIAELAGTTRRTSGIATPDALIAATALVHGIPLMTRNRRHFDRVAALRLVVPD
jgi:predicted nucleic acid-binding protein